MGLLVLGWAEGPGGGPTCGPCRLTPPAGLRYGEPIGGPVGAVGMGRGWGPLAPNPCRGLMVGSCWRTGVMGR